MPDQHGTNLFTSDPGLAELLALYLPAPLLAHLQPHLVQLGALAGGVLDSLAHTADKHPPELQHRTRSGMDIQRVVKHPAYVELERVAFSELGLAAMSHRPGVLGWHASFPPAAKYALTYLFVQAEFGVCCPLSMTDSLTRTLRKFAAPELLARYFPSLTTQVFDELSQGAMFMTEQGAGSDVAATATRAVPDGDAYQLHGDKWFCSNPDAALAMVLARIEGAPAGMKGVSLFLLPRVLPDGSHNTHRIVRLKDKLGTRSMASGEIQLAGARAWLVGDAGRGFVQMADMVNNSRLSNGVRAAGLMRRAYSEALFVATHRRAFNKRLIDMPLMRRQLVKLLLPTEQARSMVFQTADALRRADEGVAGVAGDAGDGSAHALIRILTPLIKFRACRDARKVTGDAMEVRGGCGYIEDWADPRLVRDAHLGSIWEGTSNIVALDVLRAIRKDDALTALCSHLLGLLTRSALHPVARQVFETALESASTQAKAVADAAQGGEHLARQVASALYHVTSAITMAWEASETGNAQRMRWAQLVLRERFLTTRQLTYDVSEPVCMSTVLGTEAQDSEVAVVNLF